MLRLNPYWSMSLTLHMSPTVSELIHIIPHNLLSDECMWAHPCCTHIPSGQGHVPQDEEHEGCRDEIHERSRPSYPSQLWLRMIVVFIWCNYLAIFVQNSYHIVNMWHLFLYHESSYVWHLILAHIWFAPGFVFKSRCDTFKPKYLNLKWLNQDCTKDLLFFLCSARS